jgi:excisionase family DNA binding protein
VTAEANVQPQLLLAVEEAAEVLRIGRTTMFELIRTGQVATVPIGRLRGVPVGARCAPGRRAALAIAGGRRVAPAGGGFCNR